MGIVGLMKTEAPVGSRSGIRTGRCVLIGGLGEADEVRMGGTQYAKQVVGNCGACRRRSIWNLRSGCTTAVREMVVDGLRWNRRTMSATAALPWRWPNARSATAWASTSNLDSDLRPELLLFHEGPSRVLVSTGEAARVRGIAGRTRRACGEIGKITEWPNCTIAQPRRSSDPLCSRQLNGLWETALEQSCLESKLQADRVDDLFDKLHEECGVFAVYGHPEAANLAHLGLHALQHRGQESAGHRVERRQAKSTATKSMGHVADIFTAERAERAARPHGDRPHALFDCRRHGAC